MAFLERHAWLIALVLVLPALVPALRPGWFEGHDDLHVFRLIEYDRALRDGQIPPRWFPDVAAGLGSPHPIYYAPLFYMIAESFHLGGLGVVGSLKAAVCSVMLGAGLSMFLLARARFGVTAAIVAAAAYTYAPYHLLDLYVRKAFSELTVFAVLPALLLCLVRLRDRGTPAGVVNGALATAATATSHTISAMLAPPLVAAYALFLCRGPGRTWSWSWLRRAAAAIALGVALSGFFLVPLAIERDAVDLEVFRTGYFAYRAHFVQPWQLLWSPWGFGMSLEGAADGMAFRLGLVQWAGAALAALGLGRFRRRGRDLSSQTAFFLGVTLACLFMTLPVSRPVWAMLPPLHFVQFPWRFLTVATLAASLLCGAAFATLAGRSSPSGGAAWTGALGLACVLAASAAAGGALGVNLRVPTLARIGFKDAAPAQLLDRGASAEANPTVLDAAFVRGHAVRWFDHLPRGAFAAAPGAADLARPRVEVVEGQARVAGLVERAGLLACRVEAASHARLRLNVWRFPGWTVEVDGARVPPIDAPRQRGVLSIDVGPGAHDVRAVFRRTPARWTGDLLTVAGAAALLAAGLLQGRRRTRSAGS